MLYDHLCPSRRERSQDQATVGQSIAAKVEDMIIAPDMEFASATHLQFVSFGCRSYFERKIEIFRNQSE